MFSEKLLIDYIRENLIDNSIEISSYSVVNNKVTVYYYFTDTETIREFVIGILDLIGWVYSKI